MRSVRLEGLALAALAGGQRGVAQRGEGRRQERGIAGGEGVQGVEIARLGGEGQERGGGAAIALAEAAGEGLARVVAAALGEGEGGGPHGIVERAGRGDDAAHAVDHHHVPQAGEERGELLARPVGVEDEGPQRQVERHARLAPRRAASRALTSASRPERASSSTRPASASCRACPRSPRATAHSARRSATSRSAHSST